MILAFFTATAAVLRLAGRHLALSVIVLANVDQVRIRRSLSGRQTCPRLRRVKPRPDGQSTAAEDVAGAVALRGVTPHVVVTRYTTVGRRLPKRGQAAPFPAQL